jgi:hypothetical protein
MAKAAKPPVDPATRCMLRRVAKCIEKVEGKFTAIAFLRYVHRVSDQAADVFEAAANTIERLEKDNKKLRRELRKALNNDPARRHLWQPRRYPQRRRA